MQSDYQVANSTQTLALGTHKVLRNTYMMLGLTMVPTVIGALVGMSINFSFMAQHPIMAFIGLLAGVVGLQYAIVANKDSALGVALLLALTGFLGLMLGPILQVALHLRNGPQLIGLAAGGTGIIFLTLASIATVSKRDFTGIGNFLFVGMILLILASFANLFLHIPALSLAISAIVILVFSGYILYEVNNIVRGGETNYVLATLTLYMAIYNIFVNLLQLLMALMGERD